MKKIAWISGSTRGIGKGIALQLGKDGYALIISGTKALEDQPDVLAPFIEAGFEAHYVKCNIGVEEERKAAFQYIRETFGRLDVLVNNAGVAPKVRNDVLQMTEESMDYVLGINLKGTFFMCQQAANEMIGYKKTNGEDYSPRIINISSMSAYTSSTSRGEYCISKAGIAMVTKLFADRLAVENIPVFEVRPGIIETDMTAVVKDKYVKLISEGVTPIRRMGQPEDVAKIVSAAASGLLDFGTGTVLNADGGFHIQRL